MRADDALKYAAAILRERTDWALDAIGGSMCDQDGHELETDAIHDITMDIAKLAAQFDNPNVYSDGRLVKTSAWIADGEVGTSHVWHPDPAQEKPHSWRGNLPSYDPSIPSPGLYEVTTYPEKQEIHVRVVKAV